LGTALIELIAITPSGSGIGIYRHVENQKIVYTSVEPNLKVVAV
jgi:hypothetical protein